MVFRITFMALFSEQHRSSAHSVANRFARAGKTNIQHVKQPNDNATKQHEIKQTIATMYIKPIRNNNSDIIIINQPMYLNPIVVKQ